MDYFDQFNKQKYVNEGLFGKLFSKKEPENQTSKEYGFYKKADGTFVFGRDSVAEVVNNGANTSEAALIDLNLPKNPKLNFLVAPGTSFHAKKLNIDSNNEIVSLFVGEWKSGDFKGKRFEGVFGGHSFYGNFYGDYTDYKPNVEDGQEPYTFLGGTFYDYSGKGILGLPNTLIIEDKKFNFITIPVGRMLSFETKNNRKGYIKILKRLDGSDSNFSFEILSGLKGDFARVVNLDWKYFRDNWNTGIFEIIPATTVPSSTKNIAGLIQIDSADAIVKMYLTPSNEDPLGTTIQSTSGIAPVKSKEDTFDLTKIVGLGIKNLRGEKGKLIGDTNPIVNVDIAGDYQRTKFNEVVSNIESGEFLADLKEIKKYISAGVVDGYGPFIFLKKIFNNNPGKEIFNHLKANKPTSKKNIKEVGAGKMNKPTFQGPTTKTTSKTSSNPSQSITEPKHGLEASLKRLNDFMEFLVENIVTKKGVPRENVKNMIVKNIQRLIGVPEPVVSIEPTKSNVSAPETSSGTGTVKDILGKGGITETIRLEIRNIMKDNF